MSEVHFISFLPLFQPLIRDEGDIEVLSGILERQQAIVKKCNVTKAMQSKTEDIQYETLRRLEDEVADEVRKRSCSPAQLQMLCYDLIDLLKSRYDPKGKAEWKWKAEKEVKRSKDTAQEVPSLPAQCKRSISTGVVRKRGFPSDISPSSDSCSKRPSSTGNITQGKNPDNIQRPTADGRNAVNLLEVEQETKFEVDNAGNVPKVPEGDGSADVSTKRISSDCSDKQHFAALEQSEISSVRYDTEIEADTSRIVLREDFRACEAVLGLTAL